MQHNQQSEQQPWHGGYHNPFMSPFGYPPPVQQYLQMPTSEKHLDKAPPKAPLSSPPKPTCVDPDEEVELFFDWMIARNIRQASNLQTARDLVLDEGANLRYLWEWSAADSKTKNDRLARVGDGLRSRIHTAIKDYQSEVRSRDPSPSKGDVDGRIELDDGDDDEDLLTSEMNDLI